MSCIHDLDDDWKCRKCGIDLAPADLPAIVGEGKGTPNGVKVAEIGKRTPNQGIVASGENRVFPGPDVLDSPETVLRARSPQKQSFDRMLKVAVEARNESMRAWDRAIDAILKEMKGV